MFVSRVVTSFVHLMYYFLFVFSRLMGASEKSSHDIRCSFSGLEIASTPFFPRSRASTCFRVLLFREVSPLSPSLELARLDGGIL